MKSTTTEIEKLEVRIGDNGVVQLKLDALSPAGRAIFLDAIRETPEWLDDGDRPRPCKVLNWRCVLLESHEGLPPIGSGISPETK